MRAWVLAALAVATGSSAQDGYFTAEQAERGRGVYRNACAVCHGIDLTGGPSSSLKGPRFADRWNPGAGVSELVGWGTASVDDLFFIIRTTMPQGAVGSLAVEQQVDVLAYILSENGYRVGEGELTADSALLEDIPIEWRGGKNIAEIEAPAYIEGDRGTEPSDASYLPSRLLKNASSNPRDWLYHTHDYTGRRFVDLEDIHRGNVDRLRAVCTYQLGEMSNFQTGPIVYDGTMFLTTVRVTSAIDAETCRPKWRYTWAPRATEVWRNNRGVAVANGRVIRGTSDGYLVALDALDGRLLWARRIANTDVGETLTMAPMIYDDLVLIGPAGSENAISGWVGAFEIDNGEPVWRFKTVPGAREDGVDSWDNPESIVLGGGAVWTPFTLDPDREELYVAVTNPSPDLNVAVRPGENLYTNSMVALDVRSGELRWYEQLVPSDFHDWDLTQVSPLYETAIEGTERRLVATVGKDGVLRALDRQTHEKWFETEVTTRENVDVPLSAEGVRACPGVLGGVQWNGPAYNDNTNMLYVPAVDWCTTFHLSDEVRFIPGKMYMGGYLTLDDVGTGRLTAIDASSGALAWRYDSPRPMVGAVTTTAGGLVLTGELTGDFLVLDAGTGEELFRFYTGGPIGGGIVSYESGGRQHIAVMSGRASALFESSGSPTAYVFALP